MRKVARRKQMLKPLSSNFSGAGNFWRAAMTRQLFCRAGQRVIFGDQLIMRRKPAHDSASHGLFGRHEAAPATRNDSKAELVAKEGVRLMRQHWPGLARAPGTARDLPRPGAYSTRPFEFQFPLNAHAEAAAHVSKEELYPRKRAQGSLQPKPHDVFKYFPAQELVCGIVL
jgi:hypothetical protein